MPTARECFKQPLRRRSLSSRYWVYPPGYTSQIDSLRLQELSIIIVVRCMVSLKLRRAMHGTNLQRWGSILLAVGRVIKFLTWEIYTACPKVSFLPRFARESSHLWLSGHEFLTWNFSLHCIARHKNSRWDRGMWRKFSTISKSFLLIFHLPDYGLYWLETRLEFNLQWISPRYKWLYFLIVSMWDTVTVKNSLSSKVLLFRLPYFCMCDAFANWIIKTWNNDQSWRKRFGNE